MDRSFIESLNDKLKIRQRELASVFDDIRAQVSSQIDSPTFETRMALLLVRSSELKSQIEILESTIKSSHWYDVASRDEPIMSDEEFREFFNLDDDLWQEDGELFMSDPIIPPKDSDPAGSKTYKNKAE